MSMTTAKRVRDKQPAAAGTVPTSAARHSHILETVGVSRPPNHDSDAGARRVVPISAQHPLLRGGFAAIVFSGRREALGEIAGEPTARTPAKFVMEDPTLSPAEDFARSSGSTLPRWLTHELRAVPGVCFVLTSPQHPAVDQLVKSGAKQDEHFLLTDGVAHDDRDADLEQGLGSLLRAEIGDGPIVVLGYGHQGKRTVTCLRNRLHVALPRVCIHDEHAESRAAAERDGIRATNDDTVVNDAAVMIASPLARYSRIAGLVDRAATAGARVFDNARRVSGLRHWQRRGRVMLDEAAARAFTIIDTMNESETPLAEARTRHSNILTNVRMSQKTCRVTCDQPLMRSLISAHVVRQDKRSLGDTVMPHLHSGQALSFAEAKAIDLASRWIGEGVADETFDGLQRAFVSTGDRATHGFFAARELCLDLWPESTRRVFPSEHAVDLGATGLERMLKGHLDAREMVSTMQTPTQRVALGIAAAHYAATRNRPIVEIGSALGGSALLMAAATDESSPPIISIDPDAPTRDIMRFAFNREGFGDRLQQIVKTSDDAIAELGHLTTGCGLVFIDGMHTAGAVTRDFHNYAPLVAVGGALLFHDD